MTTFALSRRGFFDDEDPAMFVVDDREEPVYGDGVPWEVRDAWDESGEDSD